MKRSNTAVLNGHKPPVAETELLTAEDLETLPVVAPDVEEEKQEKTPPQKASRKGPMRLILAALGIGAIATAGNFGYHYWQYASTHQETDNATVAGHLHNVSSRINGTIGIGRKSVEVGQRVQPGTPLMAIVSDEYWVIANFKETQLEGMKPGQEVEIKLDAFPHHSFKGRVDSFSPASGSEFALLPPDNATGNFTKVVQRIPVKVVFDSDSIKGYESRISPGMSAVVSVEVKDR